MKIHEYQGKEILRQFGVPVPRGIPAFTVQEAVEAAQKLGGPGLGGQGPDPRRWPRQGRRREGRQARSTTCETSPGDILGMQLDDPPDRPRRPEGAPPARSKTAPTSSKELLRVGW
jgi:hypothetical protein